MQSGLNQYTFDGFALLKITTPDEIYFKVFGSNSGGYLDGDSWRVNSGVMFVEYDQDYYYFRGYSGSYYKVPKSGGHIGVYNYGVLGEFLSREGISMVSNEDIEKELENAGIEIKQLITEV